MRPYLPRSISRVILIAAFILPSTFAKAQYVTIPDNTFASWLNSNGYNNCMNGNQLDTTCSEVLNTTGMACYGVAIRDLTGIQYFKNLKTLDCSNDSLYSIPVLPPSLLWFNCQYNNVDTMPVLPVSLTWMECDYNKLSRFTALPANLDTLICSHNQLDSLPALPANLSYLECEDNTLTGLPMLPNNLYWLDCAFNQLTSMPVLPDSLNYLDCSYNQITSLSALPTNLNVLYCQHNQLSSLPTLNANLNSLVCGVNPLTGLPPLPINLIDLECYDAQLTSLPTLPDSLSYLNCSYNQLDSLPALPSTLNSINCSYDQLINLPTLPVNLKYLYCSNNQLTSLPVMPANLYQLICSVNHLVNLPSLPAYLNELECDNNQLTTLPALPGNWMNTLLCNNNQLTSLPHLPDSIYYFDCSDNPNLACLPELKRIVYFVWDNVGIFCLPDYGSIDSSSPLLSSLGLCGIYNSGGCQPFWNVSGQIFFSPDNSCAFDTVSVVTNYVKTLLYSGSNLIQQTFTGGEGFYSFDLVPYGNYTVGVDTGNLPFSVNCPNNSYYPVILSATDSLSYSNNFAFKCRIQGFDLGVQSMVNTGNVPRPNAITLLNTVAGDMSQIYGAHCATGISGQVQIIFSGPLNYAGAAAGALMPTTINNDTIIWAIADFGTINDASAFNLRFKIDSFATPGTSACFTVNVTPVAGDYNPGNNTLNYCFTIVDALDPNEKEVYPTQVDTGGWLTYTVRFQNTGTAAAVNIKVTDTLDASLDPASFKLLAFSAPNLTQIFGNVVVFNFPNINLPDSAAVGDSASRGFVQFMIKVSSGVPYGTITGNTASIYFDLNNPVVTNTAYDSVINPLGTGIAPNGEELDFKLFPNPAKDYVTVETDAATIGALVELRDVTGRVIDKMQITNVHYRLNTALLAGGVYFIKITDNLGRAAVRRIVIE